MFLIVASHTVSMEGLASSVEYEFGVDRTRRRVTSTSNAMKRLQPLYLAIIGSAGLMCAGLAQPSTPVPSTPGRLAERAVSTDEAAILENPAPPNAASYRLIGDLIALRQKRRRLNALPDTGPAQTPDSGGMGWAVSDAEYWRRIPVRARAIPNDWTGLSEVLITNAKIDGVREIRLSIQGDYDLWLLKDRIHEITACISVHRPTRRVWFMQFARNENGAWSPVRAMDRCYSCHASGPRILRPLPLPGVDLKQVSQFNRRMLSYGACDFGDTVDESTRGATIVDGRCVTCHNGADRGKLYTIHVPLIQYKTRQEQTMPPPRY